MQKSIILLVDSIINFLIGVLLLIFPHVIIEFLGIPMVGNAFYASVLGSILIGTGIALSVWLLFGDLAIPLRGYSLLSGRVIRLVEIPDSALNSIRIQ